MSAELPVRVAESGADGGRRKHVLNAALLVFARYGYRKASMEEVARAADISRPGLYFHFSSKQELFQAAVAHSLDDALAAAQAALADPNRPLRDRLIEAFDAWTGRYVGPLAAEIGTLIENSPGLLGAMATEYPDRFAGSLTEGLATKAGRLPADREIAPADVAQTLLATASGIKHDVSTRDEFRTRMSIAVDLYRP